MKGLTLLLALIFSTQLLARDTYFCRPELLNDIPAQQNGRVKPLYVHTTETIKYLSGSTKYEELDATTTYCLLTLKSASLPIDIKLKAKIEHVDVMKFLDLKDGEHYVDFDNLIDHRQDVRVEFMKQKEDSSYKKSLGTLMSQIAVYQNIISGQDWNLPELNGSEIAWVPFNIFMSENKFKAAQETSSDPFTQIFMQTKAMAEKNVHTKYKFEYQFTKLHLHSWALVLTLLALAFLVVFKKFNLALVATALTMITQLVLISGRVYISGRAPITNMYETVMFSGFGALLLAMIIGHFKKEKTYLFMGLAYNMCTLMMMNFATGMLSSSISPLVPVLRDNFWLSTHVTTIIMSYGALALSWILANTVLFRRQFGGGLTSLDERYYSDLIYTTLKWGTIMLATGIILGGVWADYSWGRFWGWDPKETWSLIVLCLYMAILHGKYTSWIPTKRFVQLVAAAFMSVMMAWFGVNYILASGLHSYGFSQGGALFLGSFFAIQILFLIITANAKNNGPTDGGDSSDPKLVKNS
ncbi:MAG: hypothetical protein COW00_10075 [Bdellovibrio sp. CG12_big_fil_rev_8_21_14_0_65_39_13]|nr:MAG: hypothetical protein COW78_01240 [Bdellovibrio sp. CG22_combo_CG10-13_8_21_14_all_39_27]PIQ59458.1 MAG: hypothetical protein COW00_10075 [Bdellovibrio sp. CG12_big_fil_rev_8_21_14_0_65_39_13]PIR36588.1 MAG: hypothetical protein COV37_02805 [Bdellovibrio sp. CG11_big_fil_rev_8_21_14_0_20_39_38]